MLKEGKDILLCVCVRDRERESVCVREREGMCVYERENTGF